jgi:hypothetical protein
MHTKNKAKIEEEKNDDNISLTLTGKCGADGGDDVKEEKIRRKSISRTTHLQIVYPGVTDSLFLLSHSQLAVLMMREHFRFLIGAK